MPMMPRPSGKAKKIYKKIMKPEQTDKKEAQEKEQDLKKISKMNLREIRR